MNTVLITGANRGIGLEFVRQYSDNHWQVLACARHESAPLKSLSEDPSRNISLFSLDVTDSQAIHQLANTLQGVSIDILINNAGMLGLHDAKFGDANFGFVDNEAWIETFKTNTIAPLMLAQCFIEHVASSHKKIIANISSDMGSIALNHVGSEYIYRSTKAALNMVTKNMAIDLKERGITVVALQPGWVKTDMGGPHAKITAQDSVDGLRNVLESLSLSQSGSFIAYNNIHLPW